ncbi:MAG: ribbon-helix-helix protein, CopG family [Patulibacter sp.]
MKRRLSASIDEHLLAAAEAAVRDGHAPSVSALVEQAIARQLEHAKRREAWAECMEAYEGEFGAFEPGETQRISDEFLAGVQTAAELLAEYDAQERAGDAEPGAATEAKAA